MRIDHLTLRNFKCFPTLEVSFDKEENINIIYGPNAIGKTSLLEALGIAAGSFFLEMSEVEKRVVEIDEVRIETKLEKLEYQFPVSFYIEGSVLNSPFDITRKMNSLSGGINKADAKKITRLSKEAVSIVQNGREDGLPIIAYFSCRRLFQNRKKSSKKQKPLGRLMGYYNALNDSSISKEIEGWFIDEREKEIIQIQAGDKEYKSPTLNTIYETLRSVFPGKYESIYYYKPVSDNRLMSGLFFVDADKKITSLQMMSDGYRNTYSLILEIIWRCYQLNPFWQSKCGDRTQGIIMVDEIDLHLHPILQQEIIGILKRIFPLIQFVLTTHSPIVLGSNNAVIWKIEDNQLVKQSALYGKTASSIINNYMDSSDRAPEVMKLIRDYFSLIENKQGKHKEAIELRKQLEDIDPAVVADGDVLMKFTED